VSVNDDVTFVPYGVKLMPDAYTTPLKARRCGGDYDCPSSEAGGGGEWECRISGRRPRIANEGDASWGGIDDQG
jgi:hypothetical protein